MIKSHHRKKLSRTSSHRRALLKNLAESLFLHEKIETTLSKAKELVSYSDRIITAARPNDVNARRAVSRHIQNEQIRKKIFDVLVPRYQERKGGYTKVYKTGFRRGDQAETALVKLVS
ncbi:MAG: 50S ribosomal protein L17 [Elusimicrobia bacterium RIFOXYB2_FULL_49_7]|nr:MAG: 50S ribosomal protein L17 [Elusimicrobia bacterium RIFOXYB2_FULL_49_7]